MRCHSVLSTLTVLAHTVLINNFYYTKAHPPTAIEPSAVEAASRHNSSRGDSLVMQTYQPFSSPKMCCFPKLVHILIMPRQLVQVLPEVVCFLLQVLAYQIIFGIVAKHLPEEVHLLETHC